MSIQHLFVLQGPYSVGKTLRLNLLINRLAKEFPRILIPTGRGLLPDWMETYLIDTPNEDLLGNELAKDHIAAFLVKGKPVAIATGGDTGDVIQANMTFFAQLPATIGITSVRLRSDSDSCTELVKRIEEDRIENPCFVRAYRGDDPSTYDATAEAGAEELYKLLLSLC